LRRNGERIGKAQFSRWHQKSKGGSSRRVRKNRGNGWGGEGEGGFLKGRKEINGKRTREKGLHKKMRKGAYEKERCPENVSRFRVVLVELRRKHPTKGVLGKFDMT